MFRYMIRCKLDAVEFVPVRDFLRYLKLGDAAWNDGVLTFQVESPGKTSWGPLTRYLAQVHGATEIEVSLIAEDPQGSRS